MLSKEAERIVLTEFDKREIPQDEVSLKAWIHNVVNPRLSKAGKAFCVTEAGSAQEVKDAHDEVGMPPNEVVEVQKLK